MQIQLEHPELLWLFVAACPIVAWAAWRSYAIAPRWQRWTSLALRLLGVLFVVLALSRPVLRTDRPDVAVVFVVDVSDSLEREALERAAEHVSAATRELDPHELVALVAFAGRPEVVRGLDARPIDCADAAIRDVLLHRSEKLAVRQRVRELERDLSGDGLADELGAARARLRQLEAIEVRLGTAETDLREALRLGRSMLPEDARRRIVLFSDGNWTRGDPEQEIAFLARSGVSVDVHVTTTPRPAEVVAERLVAPGQVKVHEPVEIEIHVASADARTATLELFRNRFLLRSETVALTPGRNVIRVPRQELEEGFHEFEAVVGSDGDPRPENNVARAVVVVEGRPRVLLVEGDERDARHLEQALRDEDIAVEVRPPIGFPDELNDLLSYDALFISDVPATDLRVEQLDFVKRYVRDFGGGLVMLGGERSFGLGGYYRTAVEDALPVRMPIKKTIEKPSLALVLVLDRSGSMAGEKLALAKEAAIASAELLKKKDQIGVVAFDEAAVWVVELQPAGNREEVVAQVSRILVGGGTYIYAGLYRAWEALSESNAKLKHCIVLSDGHTTGSREEHLDLVSRMASEQMTVSTVGIGDADQALLSAMAETGNGEAYFTNDFGTIPQIFTKETLRASKSMLVEEPFVPTPIGSADQILAGIDLTDAPILMGYVATTRKERAHVLLVSDHGDPILAHWNYGLGRAVAFTSDAKNRWATDWVSWPQFGKLWAQIVRSVVSTGTTSVLQQEADIRVERGEVRMTIDTRDREGRFLDEVSPTIAIVDAVGSAREIPTEHTAPGQFEARFPIESYGEFLRLRVESRLGDQPVALRKYAVIESYPPEYRAASADRAWMTHVADATGGRIEPAAELALEFSTPPARGLRDLWRLCVLVAALLLPLDIALRRLV